MNQENKCCENHNRFCNDKTCCCSKCPIGHKPAQSEEHLEQVKKCPQEIIDKLDNCSGCVELKDDPLGGTHQIGTKQHPCPVCSKDHHPFCHQAPKDIKTNPAWIKGVEKKTGKSFKPETPKECLGFSEHDHRECLREPQDVPEAARKAFTCFHDFKPADPLDTTSISVYCAKCGTTVEGNKIIPPVAYSL